jgi:AcrR family transcriptional regulator
MRKIANEVGIKPASIYFFYKNKEELFIAAFQQLLDNHFNKMKEVIKDNGDKHVSEIFTAMLHGLVDHHTGDREGTNAYISLVTAPIPEIHTYLTKHMLHFNEWLVETLVLALRKSYPSITEGEIDRTIKQYVFLGNGVFWGINLYEGEDFIEQVEIAEELLKSIFNRLEHLHSG